MSIIFDGPVPQTLSREDYVPFQWNDSTAKWEEVSDTLTSTNPVVFAAKKRAFSSKTIYFDGGYVYSNKYNSVLRFDIDVPRDTVAVTGVDVMVKYLDFTVNSSGDLKSYKTACDYDTVDTAFSYSGHLVCPGKMRILEFGLIFTDSGMAIDSCIYVCSLGVDVFTAQAVVMHSSFPVKKYLNNPNPANQFVLYSYPCTETFESASFGDGRIVLNTTAGDTNVYTYEYCLKDHLGSTRMVINDQGSVIEAMAYHSYGTIVDIGSYSSAIPAREKFTGKEFDEEGRDVANGIPGIGAFYFGKRYYDPELGVWLSTDPAEQFFNPYAYSSNPINTIDPDGQWVGALIGGLAGAYIGGAMSNSSFNPGKWDWENPSTYFGIIQGGISGAMLGNDFENYLRLRNTPFSDGDMRARGKDAVEFTKESKEVIEFSNNTSTSYVEDGFQYYPKDNNGNYKITEDGVLKHRSGSWDKSGGGSVRISPKEGIQGYVHSHLYSSKPSGGIGLGGDIDAGINHARLLSQRTGKPVTLENFVVSKTGIGRYVVNSSGQVLTNSANYLPYSALNFNTSIIRNSSIFLLGNTAAYIWGNR